MPNERYQLRELTELPPKGTEVVVILEEWGSTHHYGRLVGIYERVMVEEKKDNAA